MINLLVVSRWFYIIAVVSSAAANMLAPICLWNGDLDSLEFIPRSVIARLQGKFSFKNIFGESPYSFL